VITVDTVVVGPIEVNCYIVRDPDTNHAIIIDPGDEAEKIKLHLSRNNLIPQFIINTHSHYDHIGANHAFDLPIYIHEADADNLTDPQKNLSVFMNKTCSSPPAAHRLRDKDRIPFAGTELVVLHTPGHSQGCICLLADQYLISGDTLFRGSIGRTDLPGGDSRQIMLSIRTKILPLSDDLIILPGHGESSDLGWERQHNFFLANTSV
jgi:glyoxylase-like metal-dependent hydrolase (beta-lactamase superfamily II)